MKNIAPAAFAIALVLLVGGNAYSDDKNKNSESRLHARLHGFQEVPSVSTLATGEFRAIISKDEQSINYELSYQDLQNTISQAHIHFGQRSVNGSIVVWLCGTATNLGPAGTQTCPASPGNITGTITSSNVIAAGTTSQLILASELAKVIAAIRGGVAYVNIHALPLNPGGEIRGQIRVVRQEHRD